ncbi:FAD binding domain-containing protein [Chloroflexota bacterium]
MLDMSNIHSKQEISYESRSIPTLEDSFHPNSINEAISILNSYGKDAKICAGVTDLINLMRTQAVTPKYIVFLDRIKELDYIEYNEEDGLRIGALTTYSTVESFNIIRDNYLLLHEAICQVGSVQIRNKATVCGNICRASPSADTASPLLALNANIKIANPSQTRIMPIDSFFTGPGETVLKNNEILVGIQVSKLPMNTGTAFLKSTRVAVDLAKVNVAVVLTVKENICENVRIALGAVAPSPIRAEKAEAMLKGKKLADKLIEEAAEIAAHETKCISDLRAPAEYRMELAKVLVKRALKISVDRTVGN